ncbi:SDR family NAD(P)-dependent oxidoreductase [Spongiactinospora sp. TRM90649]|uniref:SDR family NAD(P)-dependent oxidoreductase n=1 Tax=Spongiactinospora sp. TRM90649 TaxID=3031114 RepID=UPI0023F75763|nr:SDR family NAD(P)-dependent oxidoreductase [Spongiactinospora sp. TRM90649]MDF5752149.1 SDR family NAD(P)-dependent oxidoreductase [Spongiactinospora sp. TRM90649]
MKLTNAVALVTGGASGLGLATVRELRAAGADVVILDLPSSGGEAVAEEIGSHVCFVPGDVTDEKDVAAAVAACAARGPLRAVVNCAGIGNAVRTVGARGAFPLNEFAAVVTVNLVGTFNVVRLAAEQIARTDAVDGERGVIVNTASVAAFDGQVGQAAYAASKAGIVGMTLPIARDLATHQIRVATIAPGLFHTPLFATVSDEAIASLNAQTQHPRRLGRPAEFAALAGHIIANPMINGETIRLDGAIRMAPR